MIRSSANYIELFAMLPFRVRSWVAKGRVRVTYSALRRWSYLTKRQRQRVCTVTKQCGDMDVALETVTRVKGIEKLARLQRKLAISGKVPEYVVNSTPPAWSTDLEPFFLPPDRPERNMGQDHQLARPIGRKLKRYVR